MKDKADQGDVLAELEKAKADLSITTNRVAGLEADLAKHKGDASRVPKLEADLKEVSDKLAAVTKERDSLAAESKDLNARVAAEVAKLGIRQTGVEQPKGAAGSKAEELVAEYEKVKGDPKARAEFLAKHDKELASILG